MIDQALIDTGFMLAVVNESDAHHAACSRVYESESNMLLPEVVLSELAYLILRDGGYDALTSFLRTVAAGELPLVATELQDLKRAADILEKYADSKIDFVDSVIMAIAERLNITRILTVDRRDFGLFRPAHCDYFEILP